MSDTKAPERVYLTAHLPQGSYTIQTPPDYEQEDWVEYTRSDLVEAQIDEAVMKERARHGTASEKPTKGKRP